MVMGIELGDIIGNNVRKRGRNMRKGEEGQERKSI